jgi:hypothetical protein
VLVLNCYWNLFLAYWCVCWGRLGCGGHGVVGEGGLGVGVYFVGLW